MEKTFTISCNNEIVASCISVQENDNIYEINDVFVKEQYRGKGYGYKLIMLVLDYYRVNGETKRVNGDTKKKMIIKICTEIINIPAVNLYKKIFGDAYRSDSRYYYYSIYL